jgi:hypothetical protein
MLQDANVSHIELDCRLLSASTAVGSSGVSSLESVSLSCEPKPVRAAVFIDASYDGEMMVAAGNVPYTWGREANTTYNESLAGVRAPGYGGVHGALHVDALRDGGTLLKYVQNASSLPPPGSADEALMAFQHRLCLTSNASNRVPWAAPPGYEADDFLLHLRALEANGNTSLFSLGSPLPGLPSTINKRCSCCGVAIDASDQPNLNRGWASASWERRQQMIAEHTYFELGRRPLPPGNRPCASQDVATHPSYDRHRMCRTSPLTAALADVAGAYFFLATDARVPSSVRSLYASYGLCADEFAHNGHVPFQLYVRESNRLVGDYVMTQNNLYPQAKGEVSIAVGDWSLDQHMTGKYAVPVGGGRYEVQLEGNFWPAVGPQGNWYDTPFGIMVPRKGVGANLLVPVAVSSSAVAFSSTRIENWYMSVGSAAGAAAKQLVDGSAPTVQDVDVHAVRAVLIQLGQRVNGPPSSGSGTRPA